jgi:hypothetical protein
MMHNNQSMINEFRQALRQYLGNRPMKPFDPEFIDDSVNYVRVLLESASLDTAAFGSAMNHLANAQDYLMRGECGAARFELRMVLHCLKNHLSVPPSNYSYNGWSNICGAN